MLGSLHSIFGGGWLGGIGPKPSGFRARSCQPLLGVQSKVKTPEMCGQLDLARVYVTPSAAGWEEKRKKW